MQEDVKAQLDRFHRDVDDLRGFLFQSGLRDYLLLLNRPGKFFLINFIGGVATGFGVLIGGTVLIALIAWVVSFFVNIPLIGDYIALILREVERARHGAGP